jgi:putrescine transport system permease protein
MNSIAEIGDGLVRQMNRRLSARAVDRILILLPYIWLLMFFLAPIAIIVKISLAEPIMAQPPYTPMLNWAADATDRLSITFENYLFIFQDRLYLLTYWSSVKIAFNSTVLVLLVGYPMAYAIARAPQKRRSLLLMLVILPFWTSFLLRIYAWLGLLNTHGLINTSLLWLGVIDAPLEILYTNTAVYLGIIYSYLPFMILPLYASLEKLDGSLLDAAADLGARPVRTFIDVTLPLSTPGIIAGSMLVFIPAMGEYVIPTLLGGPDTLMIGRVLYDEFFFNMDWPLSSAIAMVLLVLLVVPIMILRHYQDKEATA